MSKHIKVIFIVGYPRSGSTILGNLLGQVDGFFHAGELRYLWGRNLLNKKRRCGCGLTFSECPFWSRVLTHLAQSPAEVVGWQRRAARSHHIPGLLRAVPGQASGHPERDRYVATVAELYRGLAEVTGARVLIDSSKWPADAAVAALTPGIEPYFIHLIRDPRKVIFSRQRRRAPRRPDGFTRMNRRLVAYDALGWVTLNVATEIICRRRGHARSVRVIYEKFVRDPAGTLKAAVDLVGEEAPARFPFLDDHTARLDVNHTAGGNQIRFGNGSVEIHEDGRWIAGMRPADRLLTTALTSPVMLRYGYQIRMQPSEATPVQIPDQNSEPIPNSNG